MSLIVPVVSEKMFENVDGGRGGRVDNGVTGTLLAHPGFFGSGELIIKRYDSVAFKHPHRP